MTANNYNYLVIDKDHKDFKPLVELFEDQIPDCLREAAHLDFVTHFIVEKAVAVTIYACDEDGERMHLELTGTNKKDQDGVQDED